MDTEDRIQALENEFQTTKKELKDILFEIRTYLMEAESPIPNDLDRESLREQLTTGKGVESHGN